MLSRTSKGKTPPLRHSSSAWNPSANRQIDREKNNSGGSSGQGQKCRHEKTYQSVQAQVYLARMQEKFLTSSQVGVLFPIKRQRQRSNEPKNLLANGSYSHKSSGRL
uniref:Uncharacterized protein n=1 Tax=Trichuris muris TaxID=70415 RepID=A0A5S6QGG1_TRIMR